MHSLLILKTKWTTVFTTNFESIYLFSFYSGKRSLSPFIIYSFIKRVEASFKINLFVSYNACAWWMCKMPLSCLIFFEYCIIIFFLIFFFQFVFISFTFFVTTFLSKSEITNLNRNVTHILQLVIVCYRMLFERMKIKDIFRKIRIWFFEAVRFF